MPSGKEAPYQKGGVAAKYGFVNASLIENDKT